MQVYNFMFFYMHSDVGPTLWFRLKYCNRYSLDC